MRAFYSTTEEITSLFAKQQEQLKSMQKTLEDEENYANTLIGVDLNEPMTEAIDAAYPQAKNGTHMERDIGEASGASTPKNVKATSESSGDDSTTEKHDCDLRNQDGDTQDLDCTSSYRLATDGVGTAAVPDGEPMDTERVLGTETQYTDTAFDERTAALQKCSNLAGETMQLDDEVLVQENMEHPPTEAEDKASLCSQSRMDDTETGGIKTADLLTSEVAGSWAVGTAPSVNGENESPRSPGDPDACGQDDDGGGGGCGDVNGHVAAALLCADGQASGSQTNVPSSTKLSKEHQALNAMIEIVAPEFKQQFLGADGGGEINESMSDAETEQGSEANDDTDDDGTDRDSVEDGPEVVIEDSVG